MKLLKAEFSKYPEPPLDLIMNIWLQFWEYTLLYSMLEMAVSAPREPMAQPPLQLQ